MTVSNDSPKNDVRTHTQSRDNLLSLENCSLRIQNKLLLSQININIERSQIVTLVGPNGAGKSLCLGLMTGVISPTLGKIRKSSNLRLGYTPQIYPNNTSIPMKVKRFLSCGRYKYTPQMLDDTIQLTKITHLLDSYLISLSGGELQRVLLTRALLSSPDALLMDEPTNHLDTSPQQLKDLITEIRNNTQCAFVITSHDIHFVLSVADKIYCIQQGIVCHGDNAHFTHSEHCYYSHTENCYYCHNRQPLINNT